jgi:hypothetical protein
MSHGEDGARSPRRMRLVRAAAQTSARMMLRQMTRYRFILVVYTPGDPTVYTNLPESQSVERMINLLDTPTEE